LIIIDNLNIYHEKDLRELVSSLSLIAADGDKVALIGEEGNGKSTLLRLLAGECTDYFSHSGSFKISGRVEYLPQELSASQLDTTLEEYFSSQSWFFDTDAKQQSLLARKFGFDSDIYYSPRTFSTFSGGERVKIQLLRLALADADVYLLDEPTSDIDIDTIVWLEDFIKAARGVVLYVSHDETLLENTATMVVHIEQTIRKTRPQLTVYKGGYVAYIDQRMHMLTRQQSIHDKETEQFNKQLARYQRIYDSVHHAQNAITRQDPHTGRLLKKKMHSVKALEARLEKKKAAITAKPETEDAIMLDFVPTDFPRGKVVTEVDVPILALAGKTLAKNIRFTVMGCDKVVIVGSNGCGKTTLMRQIYADLSTRRDLAVGYMPQNYADTMDMAATAVEFLSNKCGKDKTFVRRYLGSVKFTTDEMAHAIAELSGGQKAKLFFLYMILSECNCLLLDEPTRNFSPLSSPVIRDIVENFDGTVIAVSHDRKFAGIFDKVLRLTPDGLVALV
jgi:ATPase subunit of ABC transporter with duplicated ATPase domains